MKTPKNNSRNARFMRVAIRLATENVANNGGPFGAVIVRDKEVVATGVNRVTDTCDPTAHAEICVIRAACKALNNFNLSGCEIYSSCEPCPMCLSAIYWARIDKLYYANTHDDAAEIGFDDSFIYDELARPEAQRALPVETLLRDEALGSFKVWKNKEDKTEY